MDLFEFVEYIKRFLNETDIRIHIENQRVIKMTTNTFHSIYFKNDKPKVTLPIEIENHFSCYKIDIRPNICFVKDKKRSGFIYIFQDRKYIGKIRNWCNCIEDVKRDRCFTTYDNCCYDNNDDFYYLMFLNNVTTKIDLPPPFFYQTNNKFLMKNKHELSEFFKEDLRYNDLYYDIYN